IWQPTGPCRPRLGPVPPSPDRSVPADGTVQPLAAKWEGRRPPASPPVAPQAPGGGRPARRAGPCSPAAIARRDESEALAPSDPAAGSTPATAGDAPRPLPDPARPSGRAVLVAHPADGRAPRPPAGRYQHLARRRSRPRP